MAGDPPNKNSKPKKSIESEWESFISDYPPDPPSIDRFTKILAKGCAVLFVLVVAAYMFDHYRAMAPVPVAETSALQNPPTTKMYGFPTFSEPEMNTEKAPRVPSKVASKPKPKARTKIALKKPIKNSKHRPLLSVR